MSLTVRQRCFCEEYLVDLNATQAAVRAGYSERTAEVTGHRMLRNVKVRERIDLALLERRARVQIDADWVLKRLVGEVEADIGALYDAGGDLRPVGDWPLIFRQGLVSGLDVSKGKVLFSDRLKRLELLGKHIGVNAFRETVDHQGLDGLMEWLGRVERGAEKGSGE